MSRPNRIEDTAVLLKRLDVLSCLCRSPSYVRDLVDETSHSRSTINRAINDLEAIGLIERGDNGFEATTAGWFAHNRLTSFLEEFDDILAAKSVLDPLPTPPGVDPEAIIGGEVLPVRGPATYRPLERLLEDLATATRYRALVPTLDDPRHVRRLYEHVVTEGKPAELVVAPAVFETLRTDFSRQLAVMAEEDGFAVSVGSVPPVGVSIIESEDRSSDASITTHITVLNESGGLHGVVVTETAAAIRWAESQYEACLSEATDRTDALAPDTDGGVETADSQFVMPGQTLPASLERAGFVRIGGPYFLDKPVADPPTAWRTGLSIAEVHTGYAVDRFDGGGAPSHGDDTLSDTLTTTLTTGASALLIGPPGSGKSTMCKQIACSWYGADRGPVLYRESGRGHAFEAVDELVSTLTAAEGHALVVVEDAVRSDADAIFEVLEELAESETVSFLLDSRKHEWHNRDRRGHTEQPVAEPDLEVVPMPSIDEDDCARLVEHFSQTVGRSVEVSPERLWEAVRDESAPGGTESHELLRLTHRLATYADPLAAEPTALEDAVASVRDAFGDDELAVRVCMLTHTLIAAGVGFERVLLYAVAEPDAFDAVDDILDRLEGRVIFAQQDGGYRTVHEEWATTFLRQSVDADETAASERFRSAVTALLALADDADRCERIADHLGDRTALEEVRTRPGKWADGVVEAMFDLFYRQLMLAPLFGDGSHQPFDLPDACSDSIEAKGPYWLGQRFLEASYLDRGERAFERLCDDEPTERKKRLCGLGRIAYKRSEYHDAMAYLEAGLPIAEEQGDLSREFIFHKHLGLVHWRLGAYDDGRDHLETCIELARALDSRRLEGKVHTSLGGIAWAQGQYERARASNEFQLERTREIGDRYGEATSINNLGLIAQAQGAYDRAETRHEEALAIAREMGFRSTETHCLNNLGNIASARGLLEDAVAFHEGALELSEETDSATHRGESHWRLGAVAIDRGEYEDARRHLEAAKTIFTEIDDRTYLSRITLERARLALECGEPAKAHSMASEAHDLARDLGAENERARSQQLLGRIALGENDPDGALEHWRDAFETFENRGMYDTALETLQLLIDTCCANGDDDSANEWYHQARTLVADAPESTVALHREWIREYETTQGQV